MTLDAASPSPVLLTVSGVIPPDLDDVDRLGTAAARRLPRDGGGVRRRAARPSRSEAHRSAVSGVVLEWLAGPNVVLALSCLLRRRRHRVVFTDGEQVGIPYAAMCWLTRRRPRHVMIGHRLSAAEEGARAPAPSAAAPRRPPGRLRRRSSGASRSRRSATRPTGRASSVHGRHRRSGGPSASRRRTRRVR